MKNWNNDHLINPVSLPKRTLKFLAKPIIIISAIIGSFLLLTAMTCQVSYDDTVTYLWQRDYSLIDIKQSKYCTSLYMPFVADSGNAGETVHIKAYMVNVYGKLYIVNKTRSK